MNNIKNEQVNCQRQGTKEGCNQQIVRKIRRLFRHDCRKEQSVQVNNFNVNIFVEKYEKYEIEHIDQVSMK